MNLRTFVCWCFGLLGSSVGVFAQGVGASGDIKGKVSDTTGAIMQNVAVAVEDTDRGVRRAGTTDFAGQYLITGLPPAIYHVSAAMPGFESQLHKNVVLMWARR